MEKRIYICVYIYTDLHMCINKSLYCIPENNTTLWNISINCFKLKNIVITLWKKSIFRIFISKFTFFTSEEEITNIPWTYLDVFPPAIWQEHLKDSRGYDTYNLTYWIFSLTNTPILLKKNIRNKGWCYISRQNIFLC